MDRPIDISPEKWKFISAALQATGTLDLALAFKYLTCDEVKHLALANKGVKKGNPLFHTDSQPNDLVRFIELFETEPDLCLAINHVINRLHDQVGYRGPVAFDLWKSEFLSDKTMGRSTSAMKAGTPLKNLQKIIKDHISITTSEAIQIVTKQPEVKIAYSFTGNNPAQIEREIFIDSLGALKSGHYEWLDPVTGDAACEMRVPFLLDIHDVLLLNPEANEEVLERAIDIICPFSDIQTSRGLKKRSASRYFGLCKPLTIMRTQAKDHFLFLIDDRPTKYKYSFNVREAIKADLATYNVDYMRNLAKKYALAAQQQDAPLTMEAMMSNMLHVCRIDMSKGGNTQPILPVFTATRLILMHEIRCRRPIAVTLTRIGYLEKNQQRGYQSCGSKVFYYKVGLDGKSYVHVPESDLSPEDKSRPLTVFHAYNMFPLKGHIEAMEADDGFFFAKSWDEFEAGFITCDITHLIRCWAAAHPPVPKSSKLWINESDVSQKREIPVVVTGKKVALNSDNRWVPTEEDIELSNFTISLDDEQLAEMRGGKIREYIEHMQALSSPAHERKKSRYRLPAFELSCRGLPLFDVTEEDMDLLSEYQYYKELALRNDLYELHYAADIGDETAECFLETDGGFKLVDKKIYEENTSAKKKLPSRSVTRVTFMRNFSAAAFSPVHVFLSCYNHEVGQVSHIGSDIWGSRISLAFIEIDDGKGEGTSAWEIGQEKLDPDLFS